MMSGHTDGIAVMRHMWLTNHSTLHVQLAAASGCRVGAHHMSSSEPMDQVGAVRIKMTDAPMNTNVSVCWQALAVSVMRPFNGLTVMISAMSAGNLALSLSMTDTRGGTGA